MEPQQKAGCFLLIVGVVVVALSIALGGQWRTEINYTPVVFAHVSSEVPFQMTLTAHHWLFGFVKGKQPDMQQALAQYLHGREQVTQLTVVTRYTFVDGLLSLITIGIYTPVTVDVRGKIGILAEPTANEKIFRPESPRRGIRTSVSTAPVMASGHPFITGANRVDRAGYRVRLDFARLT